MQEMEDDEVEKFKKKLARYNKRKKLLVAMLEIVVPIVSSIVAAVITSLLAFK